ncbi:DUF2291 domain-containing protein [Agromyces archimandritae]|uniref:DUF2291 domain-containing protein n=1 Tax=Agromyces archimandritae TaxID=2781962 RepID=UPI001FD204A2|nr:DUF2291 domain-containing protein [Agromyces archimandritae]
MTATAARAPRRGTSPAVRRGIRIGILVLVVAGVVLGTKVVPDGDARASAGADAFDPATFGAETFPKVQAAVAERAEDAASLAEAIAADPDAAAEEFAVESSGGPVYSVTFTGVVGEGASGIYDVAVDGLPAGLTVRMQTGPAINGTELRDATGDIAFGQFTNQIEYQNAASALNEELKTAVLAGIDTASLTGRTVEVTGAFTLVNPDAWLVTPTELEQG